MNLPLTSAYILSGGSFWSYVDTPSVVIAAVCLSVVFLTAVFAGRRHRGIKAELAQKHKLIYRIIANPIGGKCIAMAEGTAIEVGDYGWEAEPRCDDGLIYLHGLNDRWQVVWYAGFRPDQVQVVAEKPRSHYYIYPDWVDFDRIPKCPYPVKRYKYGKYPTAHLGFAVKLGRNWAQQGKKRP